MGSLPADSEQFMLIEHLADQLDELTAQIDEGRAPHDQQQKLTIDFLEKRISNLEQNIEKLRNGDH
jgi:peptidoglycan hydrolase CwlO-like protein